MFEVIKHDDVEKRVEDSIGKYIPFGYDDKCLYKEDRKLYFKRDDGYVLLAERIIKITDDK